MRQNQINISAYFHLFLYGSDNHPCFNIDTDSFYNYNVCPFLPFVFALIISWYYNITKKTHYQT